jgi:hypothetical protein
VDITPEEKAGERKAAPKLKKKTKAHKEQSDKSAHGIPFHRVDLATTAPIAYRWLFLCDS